MRFVIARGARYCECDACCCVAKTRLRACSCDLRRFIVSRVSLGRLGSVGLCSWYGMM